VLAADQRHRILQAVEAVVLARGYTEATITEIVLQAGISSKTFYKHFDDKQSAFRAALLLRANDALNQTRAASESVRPWPARVYASLQALIRFITDNPGTARLGIVEMQTAGSEALTEFHHWLRRYADSLAPRSNEGVTPIAHRAGVADQIAGAISQLLYDKVGGEELSRLPMVLPDLAEICLAPYIGPHQAAALVTALQADLPPD
jgi:AcrR family transcriptional regulator